MAEEMGEFLFRHMRIALKFDQKAMALRDDPERLREYVDECFGSQAELQGVERMPLIDKLVDTVQAYQPGDGETLFATCQGLADAAAARKAKVLQAAMLTDVAGVPSDFEERALALRGDKESLKSLVAEVFLSRCPPEWTEETRAAVLEHTCRALLEYDPDDYTPLYSYCLMSLAEVNDPSGEPVVRVQRIHERDACSSSAPDGAVADGGDRRCTEAVHRRPRADHPSEPLVDEQAGPAGRQR